MQKQRVGVEKVFQYKFMGKYYQRDFWKKKDHESNLNRNTILEQHTTLCAHFLYENTERFKHYICSGKDEHNKPAPIDEKESSLIDNNFRGEFNDFVKKISWAFHLNTEEARKLFLKEVARLNKYYS